MAELTIGGAMLRDMIFTGAALLEKNRSSIDALNVFPVPDGDTGTNMSMTMQSAVKEIKHADANTVSDVMSAASLGALKGARGNSGVILSQLLRGFAKALKGAETMDAKLWAEALSAGTEAAYKAVMKPKEGTILTVSRMIAEAAKAAADEGANIYSLIDTMQESGERALAMTPDLLPVLKEAGVVDSGGKGLLTVYRGFKMAIDGEEIEDYTEETEEPVSQEDDNFSFEDVNDIKFGYCTEFFITHLEESFSEAELDNLRDKLVRIGDSVVVAHDQGIVKVHVHSNAPGKILQLALRLGELDHVKIENMREQNREIQANLKKNEKEYAMIAVSAGEGISSVFTDLGVNALIEGGQTMNPSIDSFTKAIRKVNARNVFIFPNNSNIILAASQAAELSERNVIVLPTKTIMQGISAVMAYSPDITPEENKKRMTDAISAVMSGSVTYAVRETSVNGHEIHKGDIMGIAEKEIVAVSQDVKTASADLVRHMIRKKGDDECIVTAFCGEGQTEEDAKAIAEEVQKDYPNVEFVLQYGGQPLYYYFFSVE